MDETTNNVSYKSLHEDFVSGWNGTSLFEVSVLTTIPAASVLIRDLFCLVFDHITYPWLFVFNFCIIVLPLLLGCTVLHFMDVTLLVTLYTIAGGIIALIFTQQVKKTFPSKFLYETMMQSDMGMRRPFITYSRAQAYLGTAVAILAVDFPIFPRRFAKAETYGTGVMDEGVGLFIVVNAIVSPEARGKHGSKSPVRAMLQAAKSSVPMVVLGALRLLAVKNIDYQEHVTEYGVHWNFFLTLAAVKILSAGVLSVFPVSFSGVLSVIVAAVYQYLLTSCGLTKYILHGSDGQGGRHGLLDANREGIFSSFGYLAIYLAGVQMGKYLFRERTKVRDWVQAMIMLFCTSLLSWLLLGVVSTVEPISRRLANGPFVVWMIAMNSCLLAVYLMGDILVTCTLQFYHRTAVNKFEEKLNSTCLLSAMNYNGLLYFLLANLLTGAVNMSIRTIYASTPLALTILSVYMFALSLLVTVLYFKKISTKIW